MRQEELARQAEKERLAYTVVDRRSPISVLTISPLHGI